MGGRQMPIIYDEEKRIFHLQAQDTSYLFQIVQDGYLAHLYWGKKIRSIDPSTKIFSKQGPFPRILIRRIRIFPSIRCPRSTPVTGGAILGVRPITCNWQTVQR